MPLSDPMLHCRVCGMEQAFFPWGLNGDDPSFSICDCCGVEFGYEDTQLSSVKAFREKWRSAGAPWFSPEVKPNHWQLDSQLKMVPPEFR